MGSDSTTACITALWEDIFLVKLPTSPMTILGGIFQQHYIEKQESGFQ